METDARESKETSTSEKNLESTANLDQPERAKNGANEIIGDEHLSEKITSGISESAKFTNGHLEEDIMVLRQEDEAQILLTNVTEQVKKVKPRAKKRPKEKRKSKGYPALPDNNHIEPMQVRKEQEQPDCRIQPGAAQHSELELFRKGTDQDFDEDGNKNVLVENENGKKGKDVSVNHCQAGMKEEAEVEECYEVVGDPSISSQWPTSSPKNTNHPIHDANANLTEQNDQDINDDIYSNIDNDNEGITMTSNHFTLTTRILNVMWTKEFLRMILTFMPTWTSFNGNPDCFSTTLPLSVLMTSRFTSIQLK